MKKIVLYIVMQKIVFENKIKGFKCYKNVKILWSDLQ